jgi:hypothetical protein
MEEVAGKVAMAVFTGFVSAVASRVVGEEMDQDALIHPDEDPVVQGGHAVGHVLGEVVGVIAQGASNIFNV